MTVLIVLAITAGLIWGSALIWFIHAANHAPLVDHAKPEASTEQETP